MVDAMADGWQRESQTGGLPVFRWFIGAGFLLSEVVVLTTCSARARATVA